MSKCLRSFLKIKHFSVHADIFQFMPIILDILDLRNFLVDNIHLVYLCKRKKNKQCMIQKLQGVCKKKLLFFLIISQDHKFIAGLVWACQVLHKLIENHTFYLKFQENSFDVLYFSFYLHQFCKISQL